MSEESEERLFKKLKRTPLEEIEKVWCTVLLPDPGKYLLDNGWTPDEYYAETRRLHHTKYSE